MELVGGRDIGLDGLMIYRPGCSRLIGWRDREQSRFFPGWKGIMWESWLDYPVKTQLIPLKLTTYCWGGDLF